jgi:hypothetical protein
MVLTLAISGCGLARVYNKVTLGEPLPPGLGLTEVIEEDADSKSGPANGEHVFTMNEYYVWHTPLTTSVQGVTVHTDATDRVTARVLNTLTVTNWLVVLGVSATHTLEVTIPPQLMADPKDAILAQVLPDMTFYPSDSDLAERAEKAMLVTSYGGIGYQIMLYYDSTTFCCLRSIRLADLPKAGSWKTLLVHATGIVTLTNLGDNRLRIETCTWYLTNPSGTTGFLAWKAMYDCGLYKHYE